MSTLDAIFLPALINYRHTQRFGCLKSFSNKYLDYHLSIEITERRIFVSWKDWGSPQDIALCWKIFLIRSWSRSSLQLEAYIIKDSILCLEECKECSHLDPLLIYLRKWVLAKTMKLFAAWWIYYKSCQGCRSISASRI